jgi:uncharacterized protein YndB with AHSA1/START domain
MDPGSDRIERSIHLLAARDRVWRAVSDAPEFGRWFGVDLEGKQFVVGEPIEGRITHPGYEHVPWRVLVEQVEPPHRLVFLWHPYAIEPGVDYDAEPPTRVEFTLSDEDGGTLLTVVESGFDGVPAHRRAEAFRMNAQGWAAQMDNIARHVG